MYAYFLKLGTTFTYALFHNWRGYAHFVTQTVPFWIDQSVEKNQHILKLDSVWF